MLEWTRAASLAGLSMLWKHVCAIRGGYQTASKIIKLRMLPCVKISCSNKDLVKFPSDISHNALCKAAGNGMHVPSVGWAMLVNIVGLQQKAS